MDLMTNAGFSPLEDRHLLHIGGSDAIGFLQNLVTCDVVKLTPGKAAFGALLGPQGKILFDFFLVRTAEGFLADIASEQAEDFGKRLNFYRLRAKVEIAETGLNAFADWGPQNETGADLVIADPRLPAMGRRIYSRTTNAAASGNYHAHRIAIGMPQGGLDYPFSETFPHEALLDQIGGVDFAKGCYVGQEVVSRMQHRGTARRRVIMAKAANDLPPAGTEILAGDKPCGVMGSASGKTGLAMLRLDRVIPAMDNGLPVLAGEVAIVPQLQKWVKFGWPAGE